MDPKYFEELRRGHGEDASYEVSFILIGQPVRDEKSFEAKVYGRTHARTHARKHSRTDSRMNARRTIPHDI